MPEHAGNTAPLPGRDRPEGHKSRLTRVVDAIRDRLDRLYYGIPAEKRPKKKVMAGALGSLLSAAASWTLLKLAIPLPPVIEGYIMAACGSAGGYAIAWLIPDQVSPRKRALDVLESPVEEPDGEHAFAGKQEKPPAKSKR